MEKCFDPYYMTYLAPNRHDVMAYSLIQILEQIIKKDLKLYAKEFADPEEIEKSISHVNELSCMLDSIRSFNCTYVDYFMVSNRYLLKVRSILLTKEDAFDGMMIRYINESIGVSREYVLNELNKRGGRIITRQK